MSILKEIVCYDDVYVVVFSSILNRVLRKGLWWNMKNEKEWAMKEMARKKVLSKGNSKYKVPGMWKFWYFGTKKALILLEENDVKLYQR